jgi:hypothetical protein
MPAHAKGTFQLKSWDERPHEEFEGGAKLTRAHIEQEFSGDIEGTGSWESVMYYREDGTADYVGYERIVGRLGERTGSFVLQTVGTYDGSDAKTAWSVVPGSGTDGLRGLRGDGSSAAPHGPNGTFTLVYDLDQGGPQ